MALDARVKREKVAMYNNPIADVRQNDAQAFATFGSQPYQIWMRGIRHGLHSRQVLEQQICVTRCSQLMN
jgi:hypothetical protein